MGIKDPSSNVAEDLNDLFVEALRGMKTPRYAQERHTHAPIVFEKNWLTKRDVEPGVNPKDVVAFHDNDSELYPQVIKTKYGNVPLPRGIISVDPKRAAANISGEDGDDQPQSLSNLIGHEAIHQTLTNAKGGKFDFPTEQDVPSLSKVKQLLKGSDAAKSIGDLDEELPAYVARQPWRIPGMTPELRTQFLDEYTNHIAKQDPVAAKQYRSLAPEMTATPIDRTTSAVVGVPTIANNEDN